ncbi:7TM-DISM domain-containing protein [Algoriphagus boritolerans]|uniref:7TMR-DISMED2 domain-containing protein n=1 Tax=Algoriphagus boritolerans TaxID=308111 RepID=UPI002FCE1692
MTPFLTQITHISFLFFGLMLLSSCDLPSQKEGKQTPLPFIILAEDGQSVTDAWKSIEGDTITTGRFNPGIKLNRWWVKTQVKNNSKFEDEFFLVLNNPHINMIEVYINGNNHPALITGDRFAFDSRQYPSRDFVFPFELKSGESKEVLMILDKRGETFHIDPELLNEGEYDDRRRNEHLIMGVVSGWMALIIVITLFFLVRTQAQKCLLLCHFRPFGIPMDLFSLGNGIPVPLARKCDLGRQIPTGV